MQRYSRGAARFWDDLQLPVDALVPVDLAALHYEYDTTDRRDVLERIAGGRDDVGVHADRDRANPILHSQRLGRDRRGADDRVHGRLTTVTHAIHQLLEISPVGAGAAVGPERHLHLLGKGALERVVADRQSLFHIREALLGE